MNDEYLGQSRFRVVVRPHRVAYFIAGRDRGSFRRAIQEASTRWGGITEPIIPVSAQGRVTPARKQILETAGVDGVVTIDLPRPVAERAARSVQLPSVPIEHLAHTWDRQTCNPALIATVPAASQLTIASSGGPLWEAVAAGDLNEDQMVQLRESPATLPLRRALDGYDVARASLGSVTLIDITAHQLNEHFAAAMWVVAPALLWLTKPNSFNDALDFWNMRALRLLGDPAPAPMLIAPMPEALDDWISFDERLEHWLSRPVTVEPDVVLCSHSVDDATLVAVARRLGWRRAGRHLRASSSLGGPPLDPRSAPFTYRTNLDPRMWVVHDRSYGQLATPVVQAFRNETTIGFESPATFTRPHLGGVIVEMREGPIDQLPLSDAVAQMVLPAARWHNQQLQWASRATSRYEFKISLPDPQTIIRKLLDSATRSHALSDKGRLGLSIAHRFDTRLLLDHTCYGCVAQLTTPRDQALLQQVKSALGSAEVSEDLRRQVEALGGRAERVSRSAGEFNSLGKPPVVVAALERLAANGWVERGAQLRCQAGCGQQWFVPLRELTTPPRCPGCSTVAAYTADRQLSIKYRLNSLIDRASDQGVLAHLRIIAHLAATKGSAEILPGVNVSWSDNERPTEVDLFGIVGRDIVAGEVKTTAAQFSPAQIARDISLSKRLGASTHVLGAMSNVSATTVTSAERRAKREGMALIIVGASDLHPIASK